jgi:hypothetical protein
MASNYTLKVMQVIDSDTAVSTDDGQLVFDQLKISLDKEFIVDVDFEGIQMMTTAFLNAAIGQLYSEYKGEMLNKSLKLVNVANEDKILFKKVVERAKQYFEDQKSFDDAINQGING